MQGMKSSHRKSEMMTGFTPAGAPDTAVPPPAHGAQEPQAWGATPADAGQLPDPCHALHAPHAPSATGVVPGSAAHPGAPTVGVTPAGARPPPTHPGSC